MSTTPTARLRLALLMLALGAFAPAAWADDASELTGLLERFLAGASVDDLATHERFWADDLVYTSSSGERFGKARILEALEGAQGQGGSGVTYSAREIDVRLYGDAAVVAFQLVGAPQEGAASLYWNTGTFVRRDGEWRAVAWQATRIPGEAP